MWFFLSMSTNWICSYLFFCFEWISRILLLIRIDSSWITSEKKRKWGKTTGDWLEWEMAPFSPGFVCSVVCQIIQSLPHSLKNRGKAPGIFRKPPFHLNTYVFILYFFNNIRLFSFLPLQTLHLLSELLRLLVYSFPKRITIPSDFFLKLCRVNNR